MAPSAGTPEAARADMLDAVARIDTEAVLSHARGWHGDHGTDSLIADVLVPVMREVGDRWEAGVFSVMQEHHAAQCVRTAVATMRGPAAQAERPAAVLACPPGELHDLPAHLFAAMLDERGIAPVVLGANTPWQATATGIRAVEARACVLSGMRPRSLVGRRPVLTQLAVSTPTYVAGPASEGVDVAGVSVLPDDWRSAADAILEAVAAGDVADVDDQQTVG